MTRLGLILLLVSVATVTGWAHAFLDHADPRVGSQGKTSPWQVKIWFTEKVEPVLSRIEVFDSAGKEVDRHDSQVNSTNPAILEVSLPPTVVIRGFKFKPETVTVRAGETVEWKNEDIVPHTATADAEVAQKPVFDSGTIDTGAAWRYVARKKGTYNYTCAYHPNMTGKLIVQ